MTQSIPAPMSDLSLSSDTPLTLERSVLGLAERWKLLPHTSIARPALILASGETVTIGDPLLAPPDGRLCIRYSAAHPALGEAGMELAVELVDADGTIHPLAAFDIPAGAAGLALREGLVDIRPWAGSACRLRLSCRSHARAQGDQLAIIDLSAGDSDRMPLLRARGFNQERTTNEIAHFSQVYDHAMYAAPARNQASAPAEVTPLAHLTRPGGNVQSPAAHCDRNAFPDPQDLEPVPVGAYDYAHRLLGLSLKAVAPNFGRRLVELSRERDAGQPLRVMSLCAGAARFEAQFAAAAGDRVEWTLLDISEGLLRQAATSFPAESPPRLILADLNDAAYFGVDFDVVMCVSGLHHIVELEHVAKFIHDSLVADGEFWSIGEAIGRSGNRLFEADYRRANAVFRSLPDRLRRNRVSGRPDENLPNVDYSEATFEGIRSDEIEGVLSRFFEPVHLYRRNCFLWRLMDLAYTDNYDLSSPSDIEHIKTAVAAEVEHFRAGGRASELHAIYRKRVF